MQTLEVPTLKRDNKWERDFLEELLNDDVCVLQEEPVPGPDQFPYLLVQTKSDATESTQQIMQWLSEKGIGLVINPQKEPYPDMVMTYGMIWGLRNCGDIWGIPFASENFQAGEPSEEVLPSYARSILKQFLQDQGVLQPRFQTVIDAKKIEVCFSLESLDKPPQEEHEGLLEAISWFLPPNYSVALASEKDLKGFVAV